MINSKKKKRPIEAASVFLSYMEVRTQGQPKSYAQTADKGSVSCSRTLQQGGQMLRFLQFKSRAFTKYSPLLLSKNPHE